MPKPPITLGKRAAEIPPRPKGSVYPPPFKPAVEGRTKRPLGDAFGLRNFGVNLTTLAPGAATALLHRHHVSDEFVYVLEGRPTLETEEGRQALSPGMCVGFPANGVAHRLINETDAEVVLIEIGDRLPGDAADYPENDLAVRHDGEGWVFSHKDGTPY